MSGLIAAVGLNPLRLVRAVLTLGSHRVYAITTDETEHLVGPITDALRKLGSAAEVVGVPGDAYRIDESLLGLRERIDPVGCTMLIAGGTKPIIAAQSLFAAEHQLASAVLDERGGRLVYNDGNSDQLAETANIPLRELVRLHAGFEAAPKLSMNPDPHRREERVRWLLARLGHRQHFADEASVRETSERVELAVAELLAAAAPNGSAIHGSVTVTLRDPLRPEAAAQMAFANRRRLRTFEVDGVVIHGTRARVVEVKFRNLTMSETRVALAELDWRRRHIGGDGATGIMLALDGTGADAERMMQDTYGTGALALLTRGDWIDAAQQVLSGRDLSGTRLGEALS